jgi:acyl transferase domain-containing protein
VLTADTGCVIGLGTLVGDAVEIGAVMETIAGLGNTLLTGSYKANTGHTYTGILPFS